MSLILLIHSSSSQTIFNVREKQDILIEGNERFNFFDLELLKSLASSMRGNLLLSPVSVKAALAMILEGAGGKSAKELKEALRLTDDVKATRTQFRNFLNSLQGEKFSLMLLLPTAINGIEQLVRDLTHISLHTIVSSLRTTEILISVPRFQIDFDTDLVNTLNELGVREIFSTNANLSGIVQGATVDLHIANVLHKAKINVTEEGTIATAATALPKLIFNHPFLFFLRNMESGDILFAGRLSEPEPAKQSPSVFDTGFPASAQSTSKPISVAGPSHSTFNPVEPVATSSIPTNPIGSTDNSKFQSPQIKPNPNNFFYSPRTINDTPVVQGQNLPTPTTGINGNNQVQPNVVQYQPEGMYRVGQYSSHSSSSGTYNPVPTQNIVPVVSSNTSNGQFKSLSNESPPAVGNNNANPNYNDRYLFS
ncbi:hypothetical protein C0J52_11364 [Blattella germanica]|nr:hypothetical protein C0J52_11364 [Blattella germanica]